MNHLLQRTIAFVHALVSTGGPSVVRFVFWATATTVTLSWCALVVAQIIGYFVFRHADNVLCTLIAAVAVTLTGFASYAANTKTVVDAQALANKGGSADVGVLNSHVESQGK